MWNMLSGPLASVGLNILGGIIGGKADPIVTTVGGAVLRELGVTTPEQAVRRIESDPEAVARLARLEAERGPEWAAVAFCSTSSRRPRRRSLAPFSLGPKSASPTAMPAAPIPSSGGHTIKSVLVK
jgi:hypothetical protein